MGARHLLDREPVPRTTEITGRGERHPARYASSSPTASSRAISCSSTSSCRSTSGRTSWPSRASATIRGACGSTSRSAAARSASAATARMPSCSSIANKEHFAKPSVDEVWAVVTPTIDGLLGRLQSQEIDLIESSDTHLTPSQAKQLESVAASDHRAHARPQLAARRAARLEPAVARHRVPPRLASLASTASSWSNVVWEGARARCRRPTRSSSRATPGTTRACRRSRRSTSTRRARSSRRPAIPGPATAGCSTRRRPTRRSAACASGLQGRLRLGRPRRCSADGRGPASGIAAGADRLVHPHHHVRAVQAAARRSSHDLRRQQHADGDDRAPDGNSGG